MNIKPSENEKIIYLEKLLNRFEFNNDLKNGVMFFLGGSILIPTKETQKIMGNYLKSVEVPKIGDQVISDELFLKLTITNIIDNHKRDNGE